MSHASGAESPEQATPFNTEPSANARAQSETGTVRLVIRARIVADAAPQSVRASPSPRTPIVALALAVLAIIISSALYLMSGRSDRSTRTDSTSSPANSAAIAPKVTTTSPTPVLPPPTAKSTSAPQAESSSSEVAASIHEVLPTVPTSALRTIRGTVRVSIQVSLAPDGTVRSASSRIPGPSRYFERLALEAARQWRFTPANAQDAPSRLVTFSFTREGVSARSE